MNIKKFLPVIIIVLVLNLIFCAWLIINHVFNKSSLSVPSTSSQIPFIPEDSALNDIKKIKENKSLFEESKIAMFEGKTDEEIDNKLNNNQKDITLLHMPPIIDMLKSSNILKCQEFVKNIHSTDKEKIFTLKDC